MPELQPHLVTDVTKFLDASIAFLHSAQEHFNTLLYGELLQRWPAPNGLMHKGIGMVARTL